MDDSCEKKLVSSVVKNASATSARPYSSAEEKSVAHGGLLGARWAKVLMEEVSTYVLSGLVGRGLANQATEQMANKLRKGLFEMRCSVGGDAGADSASWRSFVETKGLKKSVETGLGRNHIPVTGLAHFQSTGFC